MKLIKFSILIIIALVMSLISCSVEQDEINPSTIQISNNTDVTDNIKSASTNQYSNLTFTSLDLPEYIKSKAGAFTRTVYKEEIITNPNNASQSYKLIFKIEQDFEGNPVAIYLESSIMNTLGLPNHFIKDIIIPNNGGNTTEHTTTCTERRTHHYNIAMNNCNQLPISGDRRHDCKMNTLARFAAIAAHDATWGWVAGCWFDELPH